MQKQIGNYVIKEDVIYRDKQRVYSPALKMNNQKDESIQWICVIISKKTQIQHIEKMAQEMIKVQAKNVIVIKEFRQTSNNYYLFMNQFKDGVLEQIWQKEQFTEERAKNILRQILNGLKGLHENQIMNVDLSPQCIYNDNGDYRIGQLNLAYNAMAQLEKEEDFDLYGITKEVFAPEILTGETQGRLDSDLYSVGVIYYRLLFREYPFKGNTKTQLLEDIKNQRELFTQDQISQVSKESIDFLRQILIYDPEKRMRWPQVYSHSLLKSMNIPNDNVAASLLLQQSMSKFMTKDDLNQKKFDIKKMEDAYKNLERTLAMGDRNKVDQSEIIKKDNLTDQINIEDGQKILETYKQLNMEFFREQREKSFVQQLEYYIFQRNIYAGLCQTLTYVRITNLEQRPLEYLILRCMHNFSENLKAQIEQMEVQVKKVELDKNENLFKQFQLFKQKIFNENDVIKQQYTSFLAIIQKYIDRQQNLKDQFLIKLTENDAFKYEVFEHLKAKYQEFIQALKALPLFQKETLFSKQIILNIYVNLIMICSFILKYEPDSILDKKPNEYQDWIFKATDEELSNQILQKAQKVESAYQKLKKN
ncbi:hypothetical protein pb186bvf_006961 [Paramecium bursaria]